MKARNRVPELHDQDRQWSRHAARYDEVFLDAFRPGVENPLLAAIGAVPDPATKTVADLGCGTGPLLPHLVGRFGRVVALDFAPAMITRARKRLGGRRRPGDVSQPADARAGRPRRPVRRGRRGQLARHARRPR